jgi:hypothetical protein
MICVVVQQPQATNEESSRGVGQELRSNPTGTLYGLNAKISHSLMNQKKYCI